MDWIAYIGPGVGHTSDLPFFLQWGWWSLFLTGSGLAWILFLCLFPLMSAVRALCDSLAAWNHSLGPAPSGPLQHPPVLGPGMPASRLPSR